MLYGRDFESGFSAKIPMLTGVARQMFPWKDVRKKEELETVRSPVPLTGSSAEASGTRTEGWICPTWEMGETNHIPDVAAVQSFGPQPLPAFGFQALSVWE